MCLPEKSTTLTEPVTCAVELYIFICHNNIFQKIILTVKLYALTNGASSYCTIF